MKVLYAVQGAGLENVGLQHFNSRQLLKLTWDTASASDAIFLPQSSWTEGRNRLLRVCRELDFDYLVLLDDDLHFGVGDVDLFESMLSKYKPAIATPRLLGYQDSALLSQEVQCVYAYDACMTAIHKDVIEDGILFPYVELFDSESWWYSQLITIHLSALLYPNAVVQFNNVVISNQSHCSYPSKSDFSKVEKWLFSHVLKNTFRNRRAFKPHPASSKKPVARKVSPFQSGHKLSDKKKSEIFRKDWPLCRH